MLTLLGMSWTDVRVMQLIDGVAMSMEWTGDDRP